MTARRLMSVLLTTVAHGPATPTQSGRYCASRHGTGYSRPLVAHSSGRPWVLRFATQGAGGRRRVGSRDFGKARPQVPEGQKGQKGAQSHAAHPPFRPS